jgi:hypothetical protein
MNTLADAVCCPVRDSERPTIRSQERGGGRAQVTIKKRRLLLIFCIRLTIVSLILSYLHDNAILLFLLSLSCEWLD